MPSSSPTISASTSGSWRPSSHAATGTCALGSAIRAIDGSGGVSCQADTNSGGTVTSVGTGPGLLGGPITAVGTLSVDTSAIQARLSGSCGAGQAVQVVNADGTVSCQSLWAFGGNAGTTPGTHFLGTTDTQALELRASAQRALRLEPGGTDSFYGVSPNLIGGAGSNAVSAGVAGATVAGGGSAASVCGLSGTDPCRNRVTDSFGTVGGGLNNQAGDAAGTTEYAWFATVGGGWSNTASGSRATVGGGGGNRASNESDTVGGGGNNTASGGTATVGGGGNNTASGPVATVGGGFTNTASNFYFTVGGGELNTASGGAATVGGGDNNAASGLQATVGGGFENRASGFAATVPGGSQASASLFGQMAYASGPFVANGDAQTSLFVLRNTTTDATLTQLFLDGSTASLTLAAGRTMTFDILVAARSTAPAGRSAGYHIRGVIENDAMATFIGIPTITTLGEDDAAWDVTVLAGAPDAALVIMVTGAAATTIRWVAVVRTAEVAQ